MNHEKLSALMDNELSEAEREVVLDRLVNDPEAQAFWRRMLIIRGALQRETSDGAKMLAEIKKQLQKVTTETDSKK